MGDQEIGNTLLSAARPQRRYQARRYPALRVVAGCYEVLAILVAIAAAAVAVAGLLGKSTGPLQGQSYGMPVALLSILVGGIAALTLKALGEGIRVFLDIEENTRNAA